MLRCQHCAPNLQTRWESMAWSISNHRSSSGVGCGKENAGGRALPDIRLEGPSRRGGRPDPWDGKGGGDGNPVRSLPLRGGGTNDELFLVADGDLFQWGRSEGKACQACSWAPCLRTLCDWRLGRGASCGEGPQCSAVGWGRKELGMVALGPGLSASPKRCPSVQSWLCCSLAAPAASSSKTNLLCVEEREGDLRMGASSSGSGILESLAGVLRGDSKGGEAPRVPSSLLFPFD